MNTTTADSTLSARKRELLLMRLKQSAVARAPSDATPPLLPVDRSAPLPLSFAQQRLWFMDRLDHAAGAAYHMPAALRLTGSLRRDALKGALDAIVARHESLRTTFVDADGAPRQVIAPASCGFALAERDLGDLGALPAGEREQAVQRIAADEVAAPFDLAAGPLIRGQLLRLADDEHILLITQHHIISDGWSIGILVREFSALYDAQCRQQPAMLAPLPLQYADYAAWQRSWLRGDALAAQTTFWKDYLAGAPQLLELPTDHPRPAMQSYAGGMARLVLPADVTAALKSLSQRHGATLFMTLLAGWSVLMARLSGQGDIVVGTPVANRQRTEIEGLIGFFVNTLALRVRLDDEPTVAQLLARIKDDTVRAYAHQDLPFEQVVEALQPARSMSYSPLFQVMLSMNNTPGGEPLRLPGLTLSEVEQSHHASQFDLSLTLTDAGDTIIGSLEYASDLFEASTIERLCGYFQCVMAAMAADERHSVATLPLLPPAERELVLHGFNGAAAAGPAAPAGVLLHQLFERQVAARPDAVALVADGQRISYRELDRRANGVAHTLHGLGVRPDDRVAICVERGAGMVAGLLGILKAGGAYVPLDPAYPAARLAHMLADSRPAALLTHSALQASLPGAGVPVVLLDQAGPGADQPPAIPDLADKHLAYVIYTSGSTGLPKGVMVQHDNAVNFVSGHVRACGLTPADRMLQFASYSFDASVGEIFPALSSGATLVLRPADLAVPDSAFTGFLDAEGVTVADLPTAFWHQWAQQVATRHGPLAATLRLVVAGGEKAESRHLAAWLAEPGLRNCRWLNTYGPTETTVSTTSVLYGPDDAVPVHAVPIGRPSAHTRIYILDRHLQPAPVGVAGELYVGGAGVARGYLFRPDLTDERFLDDPFSAVAGARMYKTGDLGRWRDDGMIEYLGRNDFQVKVRGFRIECGEIEARLAACAGVREALVVARTDRESQPGQPDSTRLVAYLLAHDGAALDASALRAELAATLAEHMIPSAFVTLDAYPLTPTGKIDRNALPAPGAAAVATRAYAAPEGTVEQALAAIWQQLLGLPQVGRHDHFFELGGHSLMAVQLLSQVRERLGVELTLRDLFIEPTLAGFAVRAASARHSGMTALLPADRSKPLPLSFAQQRLWFLDQLDRSAGAAYHMPAGLRLRGELDLQALRATLDRIVARHEALRTTFVKIDGQAVQRIAPPDSGFALRERDLRHLPGHEQAFALSQLGFDEVGAPFDLAKGPLIRGQLVRLGKTEWVLLVTQHHIISDGWSIGILIREMSQLYQAFSQGQPDPLPPLPLQYADYAAWQRNWMQGAVLQTQLDFWKGYLAGAPELLAMPADRPRPARQSYAGATVPLTLAPALTASLKALSARHGVTLFMTMLAGWGVTLARMSGQDDVVIGAPVANRQRTEVEPLIGFFVNTLALRVRAGGGLSVAELLAQVKSGTLQAFAHQDLPFEQVVEALRPSRSMGYSPLFQAILNWDSAPENGRLRMPGLSLTPVEQTYSATQFDLSMFLKDIGDTVEGSLRYATDLFDEASMARLAAHFQAVLAAMAADDSQTVAAIDLLDSAQRRQLLVDFNATAQEAPQGQLVHELFEAQAAAQPHAPAVVYQDQSLTYGELNRRANQVAHYLIGLGVRPDTIVALCVERSVDMLAGIFGILKAGCAYLPLDPSYPADRLAHMLADSEPAALLTQSALAGALPAVAVPVLALDRHDSAPLAAQPDHNPQVPGLLDTSLAYVIYTSGSTGTSKGVMVEHHSPVNFWRAMQRTTHRHCAADAHVALNASYAFDMSLKGILQLLSGRCLHLVPQWIRADGPAMLAFLEQHRIAAFDCTPSQLAILLKAGLAANPRYQPVSVLIGGEAIDQAMWSALRAARGIHFYNMYGPTECTVDATIVAIADCGEQPTLGGPIDNMQVYVLDTHGQPAPLGVAGELYIGGAGVARGYLRRPELTAERFVPDPFSGKPGARLYKTGDVARWLPDGTLAYLGRNDFQVKVRGFRIELGEIESKLAACDGVREAIVIARADNPGQPGDQRLVAYLVMRDGCTLDAAALRTALAASLAEFMIPSAYVALPAFPLTPNGKLDRKALPAPDNAAVASAAYDAPQGPVEQRIAAIWQELLELEQVGRNDHFFDLGGHSLLAVQLLSHVREELGVELGLRDLFTHPTLAAFAALADTARPTGMTAITAADRGKPLPLSFPQQRMWFMAQLDPAASAAYHMPSELRLKGRLNKAALKAALDRIVARHENLRTTFVETDGTPVQVIAPAGSGFALRERDLGHLAGHEQEFTVLQLSTDEAAAPFDMAAGPLVRGQLLRLNDEEHVLLVTQHHIISDGWSMGILVKEMSALYTAFAAGQPDPLPPLALQYADYAAWQRGWLQGAALEQQTAFWKDYLAGAPALLSLPADRPRPAQQSYAGATAALEIDAQVADGLRALAQRHGCTLFMALLAGWGALLARLSGQGDVVIGTSVANRQRVEVEPLIGFFVNSLALRVTLADGATVGDLLAHVKASALQAFEHQDLPFEQVVEALQPARSMGHSPLFQVMLSMNNTPGNDAMTLPGLTLSERPQTQHTTQYDIGLRLVDAGERIVGSLEYSTDLFDAATIERLMGQYRLVLAAMAADDAQPVSRIALLDEAQRRQVLDSYNQTATVFAAALPAHALFEQQAALHPNAVALLFDGMPSSYAQLNWRANRVAHGLLAAGVQPGDRVAVCLERGPDLVAALLGALKAGAAYVPLDPAYPSERLAFMLADSAPAAVLTQPSLRAALPPLSIPVLLPSSDESPCTNPGVAAGAHDLAYVIYTSGSTGKPKGAMIEHGGLANYLAWARASYAPHAPCDAVLSSSIAFDATITSLYLPLISGGSVTVLREKDELAGLEAVLRAAQQPLLVKITPAHLALLADSLAQGAPARPAALARLPHVFVVGGEALSWATVDKWLRVAPATRIVNEYGPTETVVGCATYEAQAGVTPGADLPIGRPIANTRMYVLDAHGQPVPPGVTGELYIGGAGVARGYLNRPDLTADRFLADPFGGPGGRMYKTGDLGRWKADGNLEYLGRNDFQVKVRGFRIELGEIEAALAACAGVREAAVLARQEHAGHEGHGGEAADKRLVAYVVADAKGPAPTAAALRAALAATLPEHMIPAAFVTLDAFPLTANGKLDRAALPAPDAGAVAQRQFEAPQGAAEQAIAAIWQELLGVPQVGRNDHFFELGGHSLLGVQMLARLRRAAGVDVPLRTLFVHSTLHAFAAAASGQSSRHPNLVALRPQGNRRPLFLVHPGEGEIGYARDLAAWLDEDVPVYGLAATGFLPGEQPHGTVEQMAAAYISQLRQVQPQGPYRLAGWSAGGTIAYEMAHQLIGADQAVEFLGLIDTACHYRWPGEAGFTPDADGGVPFETWMASLAWMPQVASVADRAAMQALATANDIDAMLELGRDSGMFPREIDASTLKRHLAVRHAIANALRRYARPAIPAPVVLLSAKDERRADPTLGWGAALGRQLQVVEVDGDHFSIMEAPHVRQLGRALGAQLSRAEAQGVEHPETAYAPRITIQAGRAGVAPLFCVPGAGASVTAFAALAQQLDGSVPIHGLQPRGLCGQLVPHASVEAAAAFYLAAVREVAPRGPYRLLGHSFGGWVALEMARQLEQAGEQVALLAVLDSDAPAGPHDERPRYGRIAMLEKLVELFEMNLGRPLGVSGRARGPPLQAGPLARGRAGQGEAPRDPLGGHDQAHPLGVSGRELAPLDEEGQLALLLARLVDARLMSRTTPLPLLRGIVRVFATNLNTRYAPAGAYQGPLHLVSVATGGAPGTGEPWLARWLDHAPAARHWQAPGNHMTLLSPPHVGHLAGWLKPLLGVK